MIGTFFKILAIFLRVGQIFCDHHYINPVLQTNGLSDFDDLVVNQEQIEAFIDPEQVRRHNNSFFFFDVYDCPQL